MCGEIRDGGVDKPEGRKVISKILLVGARIFNMTRRTISTAIESIPRQKRQHSGKCVPLQTRKALS